MAVGQNLGDGASVLGPESLDSESTHVVENPDAEWLARHARLGRVVDDRLAVFDGNDAGVRKLAVVCVGDEVAEAEVAKQNSRVASPEDDVAAFERFLAPKICQLVITGVMSTLDSLPSRRSWLADGPQKFPSPR